MKTKSVLKPAAIALAAGFAISLASVPIANAASNPFQTDTLTTGYNLASHDKNATDTKNNDTNGDDKEKGKEGKCGAGKCG